MLFEINRNQQPLSTMETIAQLINENIKLKRINKTVSDCNKELMKDNKWLEEELEGLYKVYHEDMSELKEVNELLEEECEGLADEILYLKETLGELTELMNEEEVYEYKEVSKYNDDALAFEDDEVLNEMLKEFAKQGLYIQG